MNKTDLQATLFVTNLLISLSLVCTESRIIRVISSIIISVESHFVVVVGSIISDLFANPSIV